MSLPSEYKELEYIESGSGQYIDMGSATVGLSFATLGYEVKFAYIYDKGGQRFSMSYSSWDESTPIVKADIEALNSYKLITWNNKNYTTEDGIDVGYTVPNTIELKLHGTTLNYNGTDYTFTRGSGTTTISNSIFCEHNVDVGFTSSSFARCYYYKFYSDDTTLVFDGVPAKRVSDSKPGLYDNVSGTFFVSATEDDFIAGPEKSGATTYSVKMTKYANKVLPDTYTQLEYIESSGATTSSTTGQYIQTNYYGTINTRIVADAQFTSILSQAHLFGYSKNSGDGTSGSALSMSLYISGGSKFSYSYNYGTDGDWTQTSTADTSRHIFDFDEKNHYFKLDDTSYSFTAQTQGTTALPLTIFTLSRDNSSGPTRSGTFANMKLYSFKIYEDDVLVRNMIPAKNSSNVVGMYDTVNDQFYGNAGTGSFIAGPEVTNYNIISAKRSYYPISNPEIVIPSDYTQLEYLESNATNYIDTGITALEITKAYTKGSMVYGNTAFFGSGTDSIGNDRFLLVSSPSSTGLACRLAETIQFDNTYSYTDVNEIEVDITNSQMIINGSSITTISHTGSFSSKTLYLFGANYDSVTLVAKGKIYYFKAYNGDTLVRNMIPAKRISDSVLGMYDTVSNTFFTNSGTGTFIAGPEVSKYKIYTINESKYYIGG